MLPTLRPADLLLMRGQSGRNTQMERVDHIEVGISLSYSSRALLRA